MRGLIKADLFLKLITAHAAIGAMTLYGQVAFLVADADANRGPFSGDVAFLDVATRKGGAMVSVAIRNEKRAF